MGTRTEYMRLAKRAERKRLSASPAKLKAHRAAERARKRAATVSRAQASKKLAAEVRRCRKLLVKQKEEHIKNLVIKDKRQQLGLFFISVSL